MEAPYPYKFICVCLVRVREKTRLQKWKLIWYPADEQVAFNGLKYTKDNLSKMVNKEGVTWTYSSASL